MLTVLSILAIVAGAIGHLLLIGLCVAGMPNASPQQLALIKRCMLMIAVVGVCVAAVGIWLHRTGHPGWSVAMNVASPIVVFVVLLKVSEP